MYISNYIEIYIIRIKRCKKSMDIWVIFYQGFTYCAKIYIVQLEDKSTPRLTVRNTSILFNVDTYSIHALQYISIHRLQRRPRSCAQSANLYTLFCLDLCLHALVKQTSNFQPLYKCCNAFYYQPLSPNTNMTQRIVVRHCRSKAAAHPSK